MLVRALWLIATKTPKEHLQEKCSGTFHRDLLLQRRPGLFRRTSAPFTSGIFVHLSLQFFQPLSARGVISDFCYSGRIPIVLSLRCFTKTQLSPVMSLSARPLFRQEKTSAASLPFPVLLVLLLQTSASSPQCNAT